MSYAEFLFLEQLRKEGNLSRVKEWIALGQAGRELYLYTREK